MVYVSTLRVSILTNLILFIRTHNRIITSILGFFILFNVRIFILSYESRNLMHYGKLFFEIAVLGIYEGYPISVEPEVLRKYTPL